VTKVWRKSVNRYWRYRGNIKLPRESRMHGCTDARRHGRMTRKHIASAGAYRRRRLKKYKSTVTHSGHNKTLIIHSVLFSYVVAPFVRVLMCPLSLVLLCHFYMSLLSLMHVLLVDFAPGYGRTSIGKSRKLWIQKKFSVRISRLGGFQHIGSACGLFTAESNETSHCPVII